MEVKTVDGLDTEDACVRYSRPDKFWYIIEDNTITHVNLKSKTVALVALDLLGYPPVVMRPWEGKTITDNVSMTLRDDALSSRMADYTVPALKELGLTQEEISTYYERRESWTK